MNTPVEIMAKSTNGATLEKVDLHGAIVDLTLNLRKTNAMLRKIVFLTISYYFYLFLLEIRILRNIKKENCRV